MKQLQDLLSLIKELYDKGGYNNILDAINKEFIEKSNCDNLVKSEAFCYLGLAQFSLNEFDDAISSFERTRDYDPEDYSGLFNLGLCYLNKLDPDASISVFSKLIENNGEDYDCYYGRAQAFELKDEFPKAIRDYKKYLEISPDNETEHFYRQITTAKIDELNKCLSSSFYRNVFVLVNKIKNVLLFKEQYLTHYTSLSVTKKLILERSKLRLSEATFLNDTSEGRELFKFLPNFNIAFVAKNSDTIATTFTQKPFIGSFVSELKHDDLTLWRMYGKEEKEEARGCAITIEKEALIRDFEKALCEDKINFKGDEFNFYHVAYVNSNGNGDVTFTVPSLLENDIEKLNSLLNELKNKIHLFVNRKSNKKLKFVEDSKNLQELLNSIAYLFKSSEYQHEHELRLVVNGIGFDKSIEVYEFSSRVYIELTKVTSTIRKLTLGPKIVRAEEWAAAFYYSLEKDGYYPEILISHLPFK